MTKLQIKAAPGLKVPMQNTPRRYINDSVAINVDDSAYYRRQIALGDLIKVTGENIVAALVTSKKIKKETADGQS